jgi:hypothetical protein
MPDVARSAPSEMTGKIPACFQAGVDVGPVDLRPDLVEDLPGDLALRLEPEDRHGHVVAVQFGVVVERLAVHVDHEAVTYRGRRFAVAAAWRAVEEMSPRAATARPIARS